MYRNRKGKLVAMPEYSASKTKNSFGEMSGLAVEFETLLAGMQSEGAEAAMEAAFEASPDHLGRAAVEAAKST